jgi:multidrug efflux system membrane fusion protein
MNVLFHEGDVVRAGEVLAQIDPRPFQVQLDQALGQKARDEALLKNAQVDVERYRTLVEQDSIPKQQLDTQEALVRQYQAAVKVDEAQIESARLQLTYSRIAAPISGRLGLRLVDVGNIVHANDANGLVVITQLQPITVLFTIPEDSIRPVMQRLRSGDKPVVEAWDREQKNKLATGTLLTIDNQIDVTTGTVRLKAQFSNEDRMLFPNQFVNARLLLDVKRDAVVIPTVAVQRGSQGTFVYLVKPDQTVAMRPVKLGPAQGDEAAVESGVAAGDVLVVDGADKLREGSKVEVQTQEASKRRAKS